MGATTRTGWPVPNLSDVVDGPAAFQAMGDPSALDVGAPGYANVASLPSTGNYIGRLAWVDSTNTLYRYRSTGWRPVVATRSEYGTGTHSYGGGLGPVTTNVTYAVPFSSPPALALACNDPRFTLYYGGASTAGFTLSSLASTAGITLSLSVSWTATGPAS